MENGEWNRNAIYLIKIIYKEEKNIKINQNRFFFLVKVYKGMTGFGNFWFLLSAEFISIYLYHYVVGLPVCIFFNLDFFKALKTL